MTPDMAHETASRRIEAIFAKACADIGEKHLDLSSLPVEERDAFFALQNSFQRTLDTFIDPATRKHGQPSEWFMGFVDSMDINAFATKVDISYLVGVNTGTIQRLGPLFSKLFLQFPLIMRFHNLQPDEIVSAAIPLSFDYIFLHELGHASLGHLDYLESKGLANRLCEVDTAPAGLRTDLFQAMELQADYFA